MNRESFIYFFLRPVKWYIKLAQFQARWRKCNRNNMTEAKNIFQMDRVTVGKYSYGTLEAHTFGKDDSKLNIGCFCSIAGNVRFLLGGEHPLKRVSTYPFSVHIYNGDEGKSSKGDIIVDDDVWICDGCTILSGVHIGQGAVIGAGCVVAKDVPPYAIMVNNEIKKYRFSEYCREKLIQIRFAELDMEKYRKIAEVEVTDENVDDILREIGME